MVQWLSLEKLLGNLSYFIKAAKVFEKKKIERADISNFIRFLIVFLGCLFHSHAGNTNLAPSHYCNIYLYEC